MFRVIFIFLLLLVATTVRLQAALRAGAATSNITPPIGTRMNGGTAPVISTHVHDELLARCLVLDDGSNRVMFIVVDNCLIDRPLFDETKKLITQQTGVPESHLMLSCTHTHSAGAVTGVHLTEPDLAYRHWLPQRLADAAKRALNNLRPARVVWGSGTLPEHVFCRRVKLKAGSQYQNQIGQTNQAVKMNWDSPNPDEEGPAGPVDPEISVLSVQQADGRPLALLANYSLHYVGDVGPGHLSADYFGAFCDRIQQLLGADRQDPPFVAMLSNGTSADINNIDFRKRREQKPPYAQIQRVANDVAAEVQRVLTRLEYRTDVRLSATNTELKLKTRKPNTAEVDRARAIVNGRSPEQLRTWPEIYAREQVILAEYPDEIFVPLQVLRIGELAIASWPGEIFAVTGLELKQRSPVKPLFNISLANGWFGYIPPPEQHALGAYETWRGRTSFLEVDATRKMMDAFLEVLP